MLKLFEKINFFTLALTLTFKVVKTEKVYSQPTFQKIFGFLTKPLVKMSDMCTDCK